MADFNFVIPSTNEKLLNKTKKHYYVRNQITEKEVRSKLKDAERSFKDKGTEFIITNFDTFYSIIIQSEVLQIDFITTAHQMLLKPVQDLKSVIVVALENIESLDDRSKLKHQNIIKMLLYVYVNINIAIEEKLEKTISQTINLSVDRKLVVLSIHAIFQEKINIFWNPPVIDDAFVSMAIKLCYQYFQLPLSITQKELQLEVFHFISTLINDYNHSAFFSHEIVRLLKMYENLTWTIIECIQALVKNYNCTSFVRQLVTELVESQTQQIDTSSSAAKRCMTVLMEMTGIMPTLMVGEIMHLTQAKMEHESYIRVYPCLNLLTGISLTALIKADRPQEERGSLDTFLRFVEEQLYDDSEDVRAEALVHWTRLQTANAIPVKRQHIILKKAIGLLRDKFTTVQINAAKCVSAFLSRNIYGAGLQAMKTELEQKKETLNSSKSQFESVRETNVKESEAEWKKHEVPLKTVIEEKLKEPTSLRCDADKPTLSVIIYDCIRDESYEKAFFTLLYRSASKQIDEWKKRSECGELKMFVLLRSLFKKAKIKSINEPVKVDSAQVELLQDSIVSLEKAIVLMETMNDAIGPMQALIESPDFDATLAAITFFISACECKISNPFDGFKVMLNLIKYDDQLRTDAVIEAFKSLYLTTQSCSINEHRSMVVKNLIGLVPLINHNTQYLEFELIISELVADGTINEGIIKLLWDCFTKKCDVSENDSVAAIYLLTMAAVGKQTILTMNIKFAATIGFGERGQNNLLLMTSVCKFMSMALEKIKLKDKLWGNVINSLVSTFFANAQFYNIAITEVVKMIYRVCTEPDAVCRNLIEKIWDTLPNTSNVEWFVIVQTNHILGEVIIYHFRRLEEATHPNYIYNAKKRRTGASTDNIKVSAQGDGIQLDLVLFIAEKCQIFCDFTHPIIRFSNVIETWTARLYIWLLNPVYLVRRSAFLLLSQIILMDMFWPHDYLMDMAVCLLDTEEELRTMAESFFATLFQTDQNLYVELPGILMSLLDLINFHEDHLRIIMKTLFSFTDETKQNQHLVTCLCLMLQSNEDNRKCRNIAYCLSLITYNENGLKTILENFESYRNRLRQPEVMKFFRNIIKKYITNPNNEIKALTNEIEEKSNTVLSTDPKTIGKIFNEEKTKKKYLGRCKR